MLVVACSPRAKPTETASRAPQQGQATIGNVARGCSHVYDHKPGAYTVVPADDRVAWIDNTLKELNITRLGGGAAAKFGIKLSGEIHDAIVVGTDIIMTDADADAVRRVSLADGKTTMLVEDIRHPYALAYAHGVFFIGGEDVLYRFDPATHELAELHDEMAWTLATDGDTVYAGLPDRLLAIDARTNKESVLFTPPVRDLLDRGFPALAATKRGPVWSTEEGEIWTFDVAAKRTRKLAKLVKQPIQIEPVGDDLYFAVGADVQRLREGRVETIPIDKHEWTEPDDPNHRIVSIGVHGDSLVYLAPYSSFASTCLP
jgi:hypothetical protein